MGNACRFQRGPPRPSRPGEKGEFDERDQLGAVGQPVAHGGEARVRSPFGPSEHLAEPAVEPVVAGGDHHRAGRGLEHLVRGQHRIAVALPLRLAAREPVVRDRLIDPAEARFEERDIDAAALAGPLAAAQRGEDADGGPHARAGIDDGSAGAHGRPLDRPVHRHDAGIGVRERLVAGLGGERPGPPERAHLAIDEARIARLQRLKADAERLREAGAQIVKQHVRPLDQRQEALERRLLLEVHHRGALVAVEDMEGERMALPVLLDEPEAGVVAARLLDLDDVGAEIGKDRAGERAGDVLADLDDGEA